VAQQGNKLHKGTSCQWSSSHSQGAPCLEQSRVLNPHTSVVCYMAVQVTGLEPPKPSWTHAACHPQALFANCLSALPIATRHIACQQVWLPVGLTLSQVCRTSICRHPRRDDPLVDLFSLTELRCDSYTAAILAYSSSAFLPQPPVGQCPFAHNNYNHSPQNTHLR
jgi:hypothetical protein